MNEITSTLISIQAKETEVAGILKDLEFRKNSLQELTNNIDKAKGELDAIKGEVKQHKKNIDSANSSIEGNKVKIQDLQAKLSGMRNQREYDAILHDVDAVKNTNSEFESSSLESMMQIDTLDEDAAKKTKDISKLEGERAAAQKELDAELGELEVRAKALKKAADEQRDTLPEDIRKIFDRAFVQGKGKGIVAASNQTCGACYGKLTLQSWELLLAENEKVMCKECRRMLYLPEEK